MKVKALLLGAGLGVLSAVGVAVGMTTLGDWTPYASEYVHAGIKFAEPDAAGCGVEFPTDLGRDAGLTVLYCEHGNGWSVIPASWYTTYYGE